jgi:hypothetical protein
LSEERRNRIREELASIFDCDVQNEDKEEEETADDPSPELETARMEEQQQHVTGRRRRRQDERRRNDEDREGVEDSQALDRSLERLDALQRIEEASEAAGLYIPALTRSSTGFRPRGEEEVLVSSSDEDEGEDYASYLQKTVTALRSMQSDDEESSSSSEDDPISESDSDDETGAQLAQTAGWRLRSSASLANPQSESRTYSPTNRRDHMLAILNSARSMSANPNSGSTASSSTSSRIHAWENRRSNEAPVQSSRSRSLSQSNPDSSVTTTGRSGGASRLWASSRPTPRWASSMAMSEEDQIALAIEQSLRESGGSQGTESEANDPANDMTTTTTTTSSAASQPARPIEMEEEEREEDVAPPQDVPALANAGPASDDEAFALALQRQFEEEGGSSGVGEIIF